MTALCRLERHYSFVLFFFSVEIKEKKNKGLLFCGRTEQKLCAEIVNDCLFCQSKQEKVVSTIPVGLICERQFSCYFHLQRDNLIVSIIDL